MDRRGKMPKRGNPARQDSAQGFAFKKDITDNMSLKLDKASEGGISGNLRRYQWSGKTSTLGGNTASQPPIADVYDAKKARRGGGGLWRRAGRKRKQQPRPERMALTANYPASHAGDTRVAVPMKERNRGMY
jgi:hypothetical protein